MNHLLWIFLGVFMQTMVFAAPCEGMPAITCTGLSELTCADHHKMTEPTGQCGWVDNCKNMGHCCFAIKLCTPD